MRKLASMLRHYWPLNKAQTQHAALAAMEIILTVIFWRFIWQYGHLMIFFALTIFMFLVATHFNVAVVVWLNRPRKKKEKKEAKKKETAQKKQSSRFKRRL